MAPQPLHLPKSLFTITEDNVPMSSCQQQEYEKYSVPLSGSTSAAALQFSTSASSTSTSTSRSNCTSSTSLKRNLHLLSDVLDVLDSNPQHPTSTTRAATMREEKFDGTFARWEANAPSSSSSIVASFHPSSEGDPPPTRPLRRFSPVA